MCACGSSDPLTCPSARLRRVWLTRATKASLAPQRLWECSATGVRSAEGPTSAAAPWGGISAGARPSRFSPKRSRQCSLRHVTASACVGPARRRQPLSPREGEPSLRPSSPGSPSPGRRWHRVPAPNAIEIRRRPVLGHLPLADEPRWKLDADDGAQHLLNELSGSVRDLPLPERVAPDDLSLASLSRDLRPPRRSPVDTTRREAWPPPTVSPVS